MKNDYLFPITGYVNDCGLSIYGSDYQFTFLQNHGISKEATCVIPEDGFVRALTHDGHQLAIRRTTPLTINGSSTIKTFCIMKSVNNTMPKMDCFNCIVFVGGTLNNLFTPEAMVLEPVESPGVSARYKSDSLKFQFCMDEKTTCEATIGSSNTFSSGIHGSSIENKLVRFVIRLSDPKPLSCALDYYYTLIKCMQFMTNRENVCVDMIGVHLNDKTTKRDIGSLSMYIDEDNNCTDKIVLSNLSFKDLDASFSKLIELFSMSRVGKPQYSLGIIPINDKDYNKIDNNRIKSICSALEFEAGLEKDLKPIEQEKLDGLVSETKAFIKKYKKEHEGDVSERTYSLIRNSIDKWSFTANEKIKALWDLHKEAMNTIAQNEGPVENISIDDFVKYRNQITHGTDSAIPENVGYTAIVLRGLVYCAILKRIGVPESRIIELARMGQINS